MTPLVLLLLGCGPPAPPARPPDVLLITLDTVRADRIGAWGRADAQTDALDALAARGRVYTRAYSPLPLTTPAHGTILTGRTPPALGLRSNGSGRLESSAMTLAEQFAGAGYITVASVGAFVTTSTWGFDQGFDLFFESIPGMEHTDFWHAERPGSEVVDDLVRFAATRDPDKPAFAWAHLYDAHHPYAASPECLERAGGDSYQAELACLDDQVARLLEAFPGAITLVVADHGESLGDHDEIEHGMFVYEPTQHVPWILAGPGVATERVNQPVGLVDVAPTLLAAAGLPALPEAEGRPVPADAPAPIYMEAYTLDQRFGIAPHVAVLDDRLKLIDLPRPELYDVVADPEESVNLAESRPDEVRRLRALIAAMDVPPAGAHLAGDPDPEVIARLEALGYVTGEFVGDPDTAPVDPKDARQLILDSQTANVLVASGKVVRARDLLRSLVERRPDAIEFYTRLAPLEAATGEADRAAGTLEAALARDPGNGTVQFAVGVQRARSGRYHEANAMFQAAEKTLPWAARARVMAVSSLFDAGAEEEAIQLATQYLAEHPEEHGVAGVVGVYFAERGVFEQAMVLLQLALQAEVPERNVAYYVAAAALGRGDRDRARELLELELEHHPGNVQAQVALLRILAMQHDWEGTLQRTATVPASQPDRAAARVHALIELHRSEQARRELAIARQRFPDLPVFARFAEQLEAPE